MLINPGDVADQILANARQWAAEQRDRYTAEIRAAAGRNERLRTRAVYAQVVSLGEALAMPGRLSALMRSSPNILSTYATDPYPVSAYVRSGHRDARLRDFDELAAIGRYLVSHPGLPWVRAPRLKRAAMGARRDDMPERRPPDELSGLGYAAATAIYVELSDPPKRRSALSHVPMPDRFRQLFHDWAAGKVNVTEILAE